MELADGLAPRTEPTGLGQPLETHSSQKKPQHLKPDPSHPQQDNKFNTTPNPDMVRPGSGAEELWLNLSEQVMDLTLNASPQQHSVDVGEPMDKTSERVANLLLISADDCSGLNRTSHSKIDIDYISRRFSELQELDFSFKSEESEERAEFESSHGNFVLQLEDSYDVQEESEAEEWEQELVSELQNRDVDVSKSMSDSLQKRTINSCQASGSDRSSNKHQEEIPHIKSPNDDSSQLFGSSTPGSDSSGTSSHHLRNSVGGSLSEVPQISILQSISNSIDAQDLKEEHEDSKDDDGSYVPQKNIVTLICKEPQSEEANNTGEEEDDAGHKSTLEKTSILEEEEDEEDNNDADGELKMNSNDGDISELNSEESVGEDVTRLNSNGPPLDGREGGFEEDEMQEKGSDKEENRDSASEEDKEMLKEEVLDGNLEKEETEDESGRKKALDESWELESEEKETQEEVSKKKESGEVEMQKDETQEVEFDKEKMQKRDEQMEEFEEAEEMLQESEESDLKDEDTQEEEYQEETSELKKEDKQSEDEEMKETTSSKSTLIGSSPSFPKIQLVENVELDTNWTREESVEKTQVEASKEEKKSEETVVEEDETREWKSGEDSVSQEEESEKEEFEERLKEDVQENNLGEDDPRKKKIEGEEEEEEDAKETRGSFKSTLINTSPNLQ
ncbi:hypothetical protein ILYODFUR_037812, partial [Ilyodon furcidens]